MGFQQQFWAWETNYCTEIVLKLIKIVITVYYWLAYNFMIYENVNTRHLGMGPQVNVHLNPGS